MSEETDEQVNSEQEETETTQDEKLLTQAQVDKIVKDRLSKERSKYADYAELKAKAATSLTEQEKAVEAARLEGRSSVEKEYATKFAGARVEAALTGIVDDPSAIVEDLNLSKYITDDGSVDEVAVAALKKRYSDMLGKRSPAPIGHGRLNNGSNTASAEEQLAKALGL